MNIEEFIKLSKIYNMIPVYERIAADLFTPVSVYLKIRQNGTNSFLLESVEGADNIGRYSFIGKDPSQIISNRHNSVQINRNGTKTEIKNNIFDVLKDTIEQIRYARLPDLSFFSGGLVGFMGYENIALIESSISFDKLSDFPDSVFGLYDSLYVFDHYTHEIILITNVAAGGPASPELQFARAQKKLRSMKIELNNPLYFSPEFAAGSEAMDKSDDPEFRQMVSRCKQNITEGDIFQIVLSKQFSCSYSGDLVNLYRALRIINPSPYMYFLEFSEDLTVIGTSPENLVRVTDGIVELMPIAGTRKRGNTKEEDDEMEADLLNDPKECAEHYMLVDLGRNDAGRVCCYDTVRVPRQMYIRKFSHVMHMVSEVQGKLKSEMCFADALKACFPAGTVTGAPKIRAIQLINEYEKQRRNIYAGAVGHIDFSGNMDMCIAIRTLYARNNVVYWQAGAGIVADSIPELEEKEINNKSAALRKALSYAGVINENSCN
ncbi:MAG: anthranilate synthase component I family protein [Bacteroidota bacterium]